MRSPIRILILFGLGAAAASLIAWERRQAREAKAIATDVEARLAALDPDSAGLPTSDTFTLALQELLDKARSRQAQYLDVNAGALHRAVGGYPGPHSRMTICCACMRGALRKGDIVLTEPRTGDGPTLTLRYLLR